MNLLPFILIAISAWLADGQFTGVTDDCNSVDRCPVVHVVFYVDTSASVEDEAIVICDIIDATIDGVKNMLDVEVVFDVLGMARWGQFLGNQNTQRSGGRYPCPGPPYPQNCQNLSREVPVYGEASLYDVCMNMCAANTLENGNPLPEAFRCLTGDASMIWNSVGDGVLQGVWDWTDANYSEWIPGNTSCIWPQPPTCLNPDGCDSQGPVKYGDNFLPDFSYIQGETEAFGSAGAVLAKHFPWTPNSLKILVPLVDEGPCNGGFDVRPTPIPDGCRNTNERWYFHEQPYSCCSSPQDYEVVEVFKETALQEKIVVSLIQADTRAETQTCLQEHGDNLANATGGFFTSTQGIPFSQYAEVFSEAIENIVSDACAKFVWSCDDNDPCTIREVCVFDDTNSSSPNSTNSTTSTAQCIGICICENNCEDVSSFSVPEDDIDVFTGGDGDNDATYIGAGVGAGVVGLLLCLGVIGIVAVGAVLLLAVLIIVAVLQATGVIGSSASVVAHAFVDNEASFNPLFVNEMTTEGTNPLFSQ